jgi:hypothetical protein
MSTMVRRTNMEPPEENPDQVPSTISTSTYSSTRAAITQVQRSLQFTYRELETEQGQLSFAQHSHNLAIAFEQDTHHAILALFARQRNMLDALFQGREPHRVNSNTTREFLATSKLLFGLLSTGLDSFDVLWAQAMRVGMYAKVKFDMVVVPGGMISDTLFDKSRFSPEQYMAPFLQRIASFSDTNAPQDGFPCLVHKGTARVFQFEETTMTHDPDPPGRASLEEHGLHWDLPSLPVQRLLHAGLSRL